MYVNFGYFRERKLNSMEIKMVDLNRQYQKIKTDIDSAIQGVIDSTAFINGPQVNGFKEELKNYLNCKYVIPCANGTDALQIALMALDLNPGDEVIIPDFTFIAAAEVVALLNLTPVFVDVDRNSYLINVEEFRKAITKKTKAVIPVHLYGQCANMEEIIRIASDNNLYVIEDNAQAFGADVKINGTWSKAGTVSDIGCTSFFPSKNLGCYGDGGAIFTNNDRLGERISAIANHGARIKYYHDLVGVNSRLDTIQAAILSVKLKQIDNYNRLRTEAADRYDGMLMNVEEVQTPQRVNNSTHVFHQYTLKAEKRDELKSFLASKGVPTMVYYPVGMHNQKSYITKGSFIVSDMLCANVLSLPMHTELENEEQQYIVEAIKEFYKS